MISQVYLIFTFIIDRQYLSYWNSLKRQLWTVDGLKNYDATWHSQNISNINHRVFQNVPFQMKYLSVKTFLVLYTCIINRNNLLWSYIWYLSTLYTWCFLHICKNNNCKKMSPFCIIWIWDKLHCIWIKQNWNKLTHLVIKRYVYLYFYQQNINNFELVDPIICLKIILN